MNKFFFGKLGKTIRERQDVIERGLTQASDAERALTSAEEKKQEIIHDAKKEGHVIVSEAQTQAELLAASIKKEAEQEAATKMQTLADKEANLSAKVEKDFGERAPLLVAQLYAETLRKNLTEKENNELIASIRG